MKRRRAEVRPEDACAVENCGAAGTHMVLVTAVDRDVPNPNSPLSCRKCLGEFAAGLERHPVVGRVDIVAIPRFAPIEVA